MVSTFKEKSLDEEMEFLTSSLNSVKVPVKNEYSSLETDIDALSYVFLKEEDINYSFMSSIEENHPDLTSEGSVQSAPAILESVPMAAAPEVVSDFLPLFSVVFCLRKNCVIIRII